MSFRQLQLIHTVSHHKFINPAVKFDRWQPVYLYDLTDLLHIREDKIIYVLQEQSIILQCDK